MPPGGGGAPLYKTTRITDSRTACDAAERVHEAHLREPCARAQEAHETGVALVIACPQEEAERYCEDLRINGLTVTIEPGC